MILSELVARTRIYADDRRAQVYTDAELVNMLNAAQQRLATHIEDADEEYFSGVETYEIEADTDAYEVDMPADFRRLLRVERVDTGEVLDVVNFRQRGVIVADFNGQAYLRGTSVGFVAPASDFEIRIWYTRVIPDLVVGADTTTSEIPTEWHDLLCLDAAKRALEANEHAMPRGLQELLDNGIQAMVQSVEARSRTDAQYVRDLEQETDW